MQFIKLIGCALIIIIAYLFLFLNNSNTIVNIDHDFKTLSNKQQKEKALFVSRDVSIKYVIDGDTVVLENGDKCRLSGIDSPEFYHGQKLSEPFAIQSKKRLSELVKNKKIKLIFQKDNKFDKYKRLLCLLFDGKKFINGVLVKEGLAYVYTGFDHPYLSLLKKNEKLAQSNKINLWDSTIKQQYFNLHSPKINDFDLIKKSGDKVLVKGKIVNMKRFKYLIKFELKNNRNQKLNIFIRKADLFHLKKFKSNKVISKKIMMIGKVVEYKNKFELNLRYPHHMQWLE
ncbi:MAG: hypothetical protein COA79_20490 [Planctomycetota bacterium]|nr:MAG: hypothetical protein COA79_20490 [Planctomycetota bacterium]